MRGIASGTDVFCAAVFEQLTCCRFTNSSGLAMNSRRVFHSQERTQIEYRYIYTVRCWSHL